MSFEKLPKGDYGKCEMCRKQYAEFCYKQKSAEKVNEKPLYEKIVFLCWDCKTEMQEKAEMSKMIENQYKIIRGEK